jgi:pimeloyl-ACP methyl ester carboxylesterase
MSSPQRVAARPLPAATAISALLLAAAACSSPAQPAHSGAPGPAASHAAARHPGLAWHGCTVSGSPAQCASLAVPLDYARPGGRKITLALSMVRATAPASKQQGDLLVNPGGPGGPGRGLAVDVAYGLDHSVASQYNIIGFDPRGVGASVPALHCQPSFFAGVRPNYIPPSQHAEQVLIGRARAYAAACEHRYGWFLPYLTTADAARDMDSIRAALGQQKISYLGYSYGTYLGQVYATLFPHHLRRMALDSVVDPTGVWYADNIAQDYAFQGRMEAFFAWVAAHHQAYQLGSTAAQVDRAWHRARAEVTAHPITGPRGPLIGPDEYDDTFLQGGYSDALWPVLAAALSAYLHRGSAAPMKMDFSEFGQQNENEFAIYNAVECADAGWPRSWATWDADTRRVYRTAPFQAWDNAWFNAACAFWPVHGPARPMRIRGAGLPGILMIQGTLDAATPYAGALKARRLLPTARMVIVRGGGNHGQSLSQTASPCVNGYLNRYLATGALPTAPGLVSAVCPAPPPPAG